MISNAHLDQSLISKGKDNGHKNHDHLYVSDNTMLQELFANIGFGKEKVQFSDHADFSFISGNFDKNSKRLEKFTKLSAILTNQAFYLFSPQIKFGHVRHIICNTYIRHKLSSILMITLPYQSRETQSSLDYAVRTDEFCLHLLGNIHIWVKTYPGKRSEFAEAITDAYQSLTGRGIPLHYPEYNSMLDLIYENQTKNLLYENNESFWANCDVLKEG